MSAGQEICAGLLAIVVVVALLLVESDSRRVSGYRGCVGDRRIVNHRHCTVVSVIVAEAPGASVAKVTIRLLPEPPHTPPVDISPQELGREVVVTTTFAASDPAFETVTV
jgi:hypothetical protein